MLNRKAAIFVAIVSMSGLSVEIAGAQTVIYVDADSTGPTHDGTTWCFAYTELYEALAVATEGTTIRVAEGTYTPDAETLPDPREATLSMLSGVRLEGGYAGCGVTDPDERDIAAYETILSGDLDGDDDPGDFPGGPSFDDNSFHVVTGSGVDQTAVLDGFTVTGGNADGSSDPEDSGGGMYNYVGSPTLISCTFTGNSADDGGGGMYNERGDPTLTDCTFTDNSASGRYARGGGMCSICYSSSACPTLTNCTFSGNSASDGGGVWNGWGDPTLTDCTFSGNSADYDGGGMYSLEGNPSLENCKFSGNSTDYNGGGMYSGGGSPTLTNCTFNSNRVNYRDAMGGGLHICHGSPTLTNCTFTGNSVNGSYARGGGMCSDFGHLTLTDCTFTGNSASGSYASGGGMYNNGHFAVLTNCTFSGNSAASGGGMSGAGAMLTNCTFSRNEAGINGGGLWSGGDPTITNCTFSDNVAGEQGGGMYMNFSSLKLTLTDSTFTGNSAHSGGGMYDYLGRSTVTNCIFSGNSATNKGGGMYIGGGRPTLTNCTFSGNSADLDGGGLYNTSYGVNITTLANCILWGNTRASELRDQSAQIAYMDVVTYSCIEGWEGIGTGNTGVDPLFVELGYWDDNGTPGDPSDDFWVDGDYRLQPGSPCIDAGDNEAVPADTADLDDDGDTDEPMPFDLDGLPRFADDALAPNVGITDGTWPIVDMGAYERADCDGNGVRDEEDITGGSSNDHNGNGYPDECEPLFSIVETDPPDCAIDARQPCDPDGSNQQGWQAVELDLDNAGLYLTASDFDVTEEGDGVDGMAPFVTSVVYAGWQKVKLHLSETIELGGWTTITHNPTGETVRLGYLPADVDGGARAAPADILWLIDYLNGVRSCEIRQCDIDRSGVCGPPDILRVIDLLNGAGVYEPWLNVSIPECPGGVSVFFDLPAEIAVGSTVDMDDDTNPDTGHPILQLTGTPPVYEVLFFASANGALPPDVLLDIDNDSGELHIDPASATGDAIEIAVQVFGVAGLLAEASDTFTIVAAP